MIFFLSKKIKIELKSFSAHAHHSTIFYFDFFFEEPAKRRIKQKSRQKTQNKQRLKVETKFFCQRENYFKCNFCFKNSASFRSNEK